jgi:hypothetical protein
VKHKAVGISLIVLIATAFLAYFVFERNGDFMAASSGRLDIADLQAALLANDVKLGKQDTKRKYFKLNGMNARTFELENGERISIYIYRSDKAREKGEEDFEKERAKYDMQIPEAYAVHNLLIHYWYDGETGSATEYGDRIENTVKVLSSDR